MSNKPLPESIKDVFNSLFERQRDEISCGPACLASVAKIYNVKGVDYEFFHALMNPDPAVGSCNFKLAEACEKYLPFDSVGENAYAGGIAIANVIDRGEGHYILLLAEKGGEIVYYDPYDHAIRTEPASALKWISESGHLKNWAVNFKPQPGKDFDYWQNFPAK